MICETGHDMRKVLYLFGYLTDADVEWMIGHGDCQRLRAGAVLIREGQPAPALYLLLSGTLEVSFGAAGRAPVRMASGEVVGEMSFIDARPPSATVAAVDDAVVLAVARPVLQAKLDGEPAFAARFYRAMAVFLSHRLREVGARAGGGEAGDEELDPGSLQNIQMAAVRFDRVLQRLLAE